MTRGPLISHFNFRDNREARSKSINIRPRFLLIREEFNDED